MTSEMSLNVLEKLLYNSKRFFGIVYDCLLTSIKVFYERLTRKHVKGIFFKKIFLFAKNFLKMKRDQIFEGLA